MTEPWKDLAEELASVVRSLLNEFDEMVRGSDHEAEAKTALSKFDDLMKQDQHE